MRPFTDKQIALLQNFAAQAVISVSLRKDAALLGAISDEVCVFSIALAGWSANVLLSEGRLALTTGSDNRSIYPFLSFVRR